MAIKAVIFDIDGCLMNTADNLVRSLRQAILETGGQPQPDEVLRASLGLPGITTTAMFNPVDPVSTMERWNELYIPLVPTNRPFAGIPALLAALTKRGVLMGIVTSQSREINKTQFPTYDIAHFFPLIVCADDVEHPKPAGDPLRLCAKRLGIQTREILYVGDATFDMLCALDAGAHGALACWGTGDRTIPADYYPETPMDVLQLLD